MTRSEWLVVNEIEIYDTTGKKITPVTASSSSAYQNQTANLAIDGNYNTYWSSGETNQQCAAQCSSSCQNASRSADVVVDLGATKNISQVRLYDQGWISGEVTKISVSNTVNSTFSPIATFTDKQSCAVSNAWLEYPASVSTSLSCQNNSVIAPDSGSTSTPAPVTISTQNSCPNFWWYDSQTPTCSQKLFCGLNYEYKGLMVFTSQSACQASSAKS